ncbi:hypothetical protein [Amycolatopsis eburnea]|uniref:Uncharacterized protein n=1 Tax=Amycolatopsis eburnea TaxID=2267691 RepID=A0A427T107_9PSEU|nr:hypothetical protein [Amycolatopsis eburnea]RSD11629.1 hypothetical protein EIY87_33180 [Amycolatopsis eburnea]
MPQEWRDAVATVPVLFTVALYVDYLADGTAVWVHDVRTMAVTALLLGLAAFVLGARPPTGAAKWFSVLLGAGALAAAVLTLVTGDGGPLAVLVVLVAVQWVVSTVRHLRTPAGRR